MSIKAIPLSPSYPHPPTPEERIQALEAYTARMKDRLEALEADLARIRGQVHSLERTLMNVPGESK